MINLVGARVVLLIVSALLLLSGLGALSYYYVMPEQERLTNEERTLRGKISTRKADIARLKQEYERLEQQIVQFKLLEKKGFFNAQDRVTARSIDDLARRTSVRADVEFLAGQVIQNEHAAAAGHSLISGPMVLKISSMNDVNVLKFMVALQNIFPGYLEFKEFRFTRKENKNTLEPFLAIAEGKEDPQIDGEMKFVWWSMASPSQLEANPYLNPNAVRTGDNPDQASPESPAVEVSP